jgi:hypothetical protein
MATGPRSLICKEVVDRFDPAMSTPGAEAPNTT